MDDTICQAPSDTKLAEKLEDGLYMLFYGVEGAGVGNDLTTTSALSAVPFMVHVESSKMEEVATNLNALGVIDNTQKDAIVAGNIGVVTVATIGNPVEGVTDGDRITSMLAREQLETLANIASNGSSVSIVADRKCGSTLTRMVKVKLNGGAREVNVIVGCFVK